MLTKIVTHADCLLHKNPPGHPEQVARLSHVLDVLGPLNLPLINAPLVADDDLLRVHPESHIRAMRDAAPSEGWQSLDSDTHMSPGTLTAALRAAGGAVCAVDMVMRGEAQNVFVAMRPPGHHCERETPMGFCFFGNIALAAKYALEIKAHQLGIDLIYVLHSHVMAPDDDKDSFLQVTLEKLIIWIT